MNIFVSKILKSAMASAVLAAGTLGLPGAARAGGNPFIGEMMLVGFNYCPRGWANADGQLMPISTYSALFSLLGTTYGGDGVSTFALPDLRGRTAIHTGTGPGLSPRLLGQKGGGESTSIGITNMPSHNHLVNSTHEIGDKRNPSTDFFATASGNISVYHDGPSTRQMDPGTISNTGGGVPVNNMQPYLVMRWCIALEGLYPSRP